MTMNELIKMTGSEEQANYALRILLKNVKPAMIRSVIRAELDSIQDEIDTMVNDGIIYYCNGSAHVNWGYCEHLTDGQEVAYNVARAKCAEADALIYKKNRTESLLAVRM